VSTGPRTASRWRIPILRGMAGLRREGIPREVLAGLTIACVAVPLGLGYGAMAGLPPEVGLYGTILPLAAYALIGSSRRIVMAPDSSLALIIAGSIIPLAGGDPERALELAMLTALVAGGVLIAAGLLRIGALAEFVSRPVLIGYLSGVGITVITSQIPDILTITGEGDSVVERLVDYLGKLDEANVPSLILGLAAIGAMLVMNRLSPNLPNALVVVVAGAVVTAALGLADRGVALVGEIPSGFPGIALPPLAPDDILAVLLPAIAIATLSFVDSSLSARSFGARHGEDVDTNAEALGIGAADIAASVSSGLPASGSGLRTSLAEAAGASTQLAPLVSAGILLVVLLWFTEPLGLMPWPVLAGVLVVAGISIVDVAGMRTLFRLDRVEFWIGLITLLGVVLVGTFAGVFVAIFLSMVDVIRRLSSPHDALVGRLGESGWVDIERHTTDAAPAGLIVYRFDAPLFFANAEYLRARIRRLTLDRVDRPSWVVLDGSGISQIDTTALYALDRLRDELEEREIRLVIAGLPGPVRDRLESAPAAEHQVGQFEIYATLGEAVAAHQSGGAADHTARQD
jgi:sulfate permease, SulP family